MKHVSPHQNPRLAVILFATALIILWGNAAMAMTLNSPAFQQNDHIPSKYTCEGEDVSPPLTWEGVPNGAKSLVLIVDDPDAPDPKAPKMVWVHWVVYNIPPDTKSLPENAGKARLPQRIHAGGSFMLTPFVTTRITRRHNNNCTPQLLPKRQNAAVH
jgi:Raf kinase inhibitor-like YbhB/YbcL family protein